MYVWWMRMPWAIGILCAKDFFPLHETWSKKLKKTSRKIQYENKCDKSVFILHFMFQPNYTHRECDRSPVHCTRLLYVYGSANVCTFARCSLASSVSVVVWSWSCSSFCANSIFFLSQLADASSSSSSNGARGTNAHNAIWVKHTWGMFT